MTFKLKLLITFIVYGLSLVLLTEGIQYKLTEKNIKSLSIEKASKAFIKKDRLFQSYIQDTNLKLLAIKKSDIFKNYLAGKTDLKSVNALFLNIASTSDNIMQLRYIDKTGMEIVRIDRDSYSSQSYVVEQKNLQDKSSRYYFKETLQNTKEMFWYSKLDLNIEHSEIEKPIKPVLRVAIPVELKTQNTGILIINIFMKNFLRELVDSSFNNVYLFDGEGRVMVDSLHKHCWSQYLKNDATISTHFKDENIKDILSNDTYKSQNIYVSKISLNNGENIRMVLEPKHEYIENELASSISEFGFVLLGIILISFPISFFFSQIPLKLKEEVDRQKEEQDVLLSLFDLSDAVLFKWNNDKNWSVSSASVSVEKLLGYNKKDFESNSITYSSCIHHSDLEQVMGEVSEAIESKVYFFEHKPYRVITKDKQLKWILDSTVVVRDKEGEIINFIGYLTDITELKNHELLLEKISRTDQLTQISNRMYLDETLQIQHYRYQRVGEECSIILLDIDYFKSVNDEYGHLIGDKILVEFASLLKASIRVGDSVGRWGGEEFLIVTPHTNLHQATILAEKLRVLINNNIFSIVKHKTASFGVSSLREGMSIELFIDEADRALYMAKESGRNRVVTAEELE